MGAQQSDGKIGHALQPKRPRRSESIKAKQKMLAEAPKADKPISGKGQAPRFVHLKIHTAYSLLEGALPIKKLASLVVADGMPALAITDRNNMFGALEFSEAMSGAGVQPIIGSIVNVQFEDEGPALPLAVLCKDEAGYENLMEISSRGFLDTAGSGDPHVSLQILSNHAGGLICLTGGPDGPIDTALRTNQQPVAETRLEALHNAFGDRLYVEVQRHGLADEMRVEKDLVRLAYSQDLPLVATNEPYFATEEEYDAHDALICIADGRYISEEDRRRLTREHRFKTQAEMVELFADLPEAIDNTLEIARRCAYRNTTRPPILPQFVAIEEGADADAMLAAEGEELVRQAKAGLKARLDAHGCAPETDEETYWKRLDYELNIILSMQFPGYFLIVADFIKWAKDHDIPVGPGRGSGAGSVVAWALTITDLDPLRFGLLFERFLNPERVSMPDFDIDFCQERRDEVIRYVQQKYGDDRVAQIITFGKLQARAVLRDVGRVLHMPYGQVDGLCKLVPNNPANPCTLEEALDEEPKLQEARDDDEMVAQLIDKSLKLEGLYRHASTHAAGVVIGDRPLSKLVPLYQDPRSDLPATQFNMKWVEPAGLVKFDFLGLKTLTVIQKALALLKGNGVDLDLDKVGIEDKATYELLARAETVGVFQLESTGMRESLRKLKPDRFEDIIAMVSLYRPGPMDNIPTYIARKHGEETTVYPHEMIAHVLEETHGVIIYQEQVMQIAQVLSGYSLGEADLLRRAMGKKIKAEMAAQKDRFVEGALKNGLKKGQAESIFELVDKFAGYGFNKSHAAAYALIAYQTAYLRANHPVEFFAALMSCDLGNTDKLAIFAAEARQCGIEILQPCVQNSQAEFTTEDGAIRYALAALKNVGRNSVDAIVSERTSAGPYKSLGDFASRLDPKSINKRGLEMLSSAGAFDCFGVSRAHAFGNADRVIASAQKVAADAAAGQNDLFGGGGDGVEALMPALDLRPCEEWTSMDTLANEAGAIGFFLSGHPLDEYDGMLEKLGVETLAEFDERFTPAAKTAVLAAIVSSCRERRARNGNKIAFPVFSDRTSTFEAVVFSDMLAASRELLTPGTAVLLRVEGERDGEALKLKVNGIDGLDRKAGSTREGVRLVFDGRFNADKLRQKLDEMRVADGFRSGGGHVELRLLLEDRGQAADVRLPYHIDLSPRAIGALKVLPGVLAIEDC